MNFVQLIVQFLVLTAVVSGVLIFVLKKVLFDSTQGAVNRLNRETEAVRAKQAELNEKIKQANEELARRRAEADALVAKMTEEAEQKAKEEREKIIVKARQEGEEIINKAQKTKAEIRRALEQEINIKAIDFSAYLLREVMSSKSHGLFDENLIAEFFEDLKQVDMTMIDEKLTTLDIVTATPLAERSRNLLSEILQAKLGRQIAVNTSVDPGILAGIVLKFGTLALDGSLRARMTKKGEEMKEQLEKGTLKLK